MQSFQIARLVAVSLVYCGAAILLAEAVPSRSKPNEAEIDAYIARQQSILDTLRASFQKPHPYIDASGMHAQDAEFAWPQTLKNHIKHVLMNLQYDGQDMKKYLITLDVKRDAIAAHDGHDSETMAATTILKHYLAPLEKLGFRNGGSSFAAISSVQYSANTWNPRERFSASQTADSPAWIEGEVFYAPQEARIVFRITVGGRYVPRGA